MNADSLATQLLAVTEQVYDLWEEESRVAARRREVIAALTEEHEMVRWQRSRVAAVRRELIVKLIKDHGWKYGDIADLLEVSVPRVHYIVNGRAHQKRTR